MPLAQGEMGIGRNEGESREERDRGKGGNEAQTRFTIFHFCVGLKY